MTKDNQGGVRQRRPKSASTAPVPLESQLLPIYRASMETLQKARIAEKAGHTVDMQSLTEVSTAQRLQITMAEPANPMDAMIVISYAMQLADVLSVLDEEGLKVAAAEILCALGGIRRFHERQAGITSEALGLNGTGPVLQ